jgi:hypothetical protein
VADSKTIDYKVIFKTQTKELKDGLAEIKKSQTEAQKNAKAFSSHQKAQAKQGEKLSKAESARQKAERQHVQYMSKAETKRHQASLGYISKQQKLLVTTMQQNAQLQTRLQRRGAGGGGRGGAGGGAGGQGQQQGSGNFGRGVATAVGTFVGNALLGAFNLVRNAATSGYDTYMQYGQSLSKSIGLGSGKQVSRGMSGAMGSKLGFSRIDTANMVPIMARATGEVGPRELQQGNRATGMDVGEVGGVYSTLARAGYNFSGAGSKKQSEGGKEFQRLIAGGMESGLKKGRLPEYLEGVQRIVQEQQGNLTGKIDADGIAKLLTMFGKTGMPGMQGAAGAGVLAKLNSSMMGSGGDAADSLIMRAYGFGSPNGKTSYYDALKRKQQGATSSNLRDMVGEVTKEYGSGREGTMALSNIGGISLEQAEAVMQIMKNGKSTDAQLKDIDKVMQGSKSLEQQSLDAMKGLGHAVERTADLTNRGIKMGEKMAPLIEKVEDWEYKGLQALMQIADDIGEIRSFLKDKFGDKDRDAQAGAAKATQLAQQRMPLDPRERAEWFKARRRAEQQAEGNAGNPADTTSMAIDSIKDIANGDMPGTTTRRSLGAIKAARVFEAQRLAQQQRSEMAARIMQMRGLDPKKDMPQDLADWAQTGTMAPPELQKKPTDSGTTPSTPPPPAAKDGKPAAHDPAAQLGGGAMNVAFLMPDARIRVPSITMTPQGAGFHVNKPSQSIV